MVALSKRSLGDVPRLQRFFSRLMQHDFTLRYAPGKKKNVLADALPRAAQPCPRDKHYSLVAEVHAVGVLARPVLRRGSEPKQKGIP